MQIQKVGNPPPARTCRAARSAQARDCRLRARRVDRDFDAMMSGARCRTLVDHAAGGNGRVRGPHTEGEVAGTTWRRRSRLQGLGFRAPPHIVARRVESQQELQTRISQTTGGRRCRAGAAGRREICEKPLGPYTGAPSTSSTRDSREDSSASSGLRRRGTSRRSQASSGRRAACGTLRHKQAFASAWTGLKLHIATQFSVRCGRHH